MIHVVFLSLYWSPSDDFIFLPSTLVRIFFYEVSFLHGSSRCSGYWSFWKTLILNLKATRQFANFRRSKILKTRIPKLINSNYNPWIQTVTAAFASLPSEVFHSIPEPLKSVNFFNFSHRKPQTRQHTREPIKHFRQIYI